LAAKQHGVVPHWQLLKLGFSRDDIRGLAARGHLHRLYRGVYAVGHRRLTTRGRWMAAVLACGPEAVLSHRAAIALWDLRPIPGGPIDVTVPGRSRQGQDGIRIHNVRRLHPDDCTTLDGIPVTTLHRALLDYAEVARFQQLRHAIDAAERLDRLDGHELERLYARSKGRHGLKPLKSAVAKLRGSPPWTQSELERQFLALIREAGLPEPQANVFVEGFLVDFWWPQSRLVVELDGYRFHKDRRKFEDDRLQDTKLQLAGCMTIRVTQRRIENKPRELLADVRRGLGRGPRAAAA
jgi:very-short-patch-repair endonuclease